MHISPHTSRFLWSTKIRSKFLQLCSIFHVQLYVDLYYMGVSKHTKSIICLGCALDMCITRPLLRDCRKRLTESLLLFVSLGSACS